MHTKSVFNRLLNAEKTVVEDASFEATKEGYVFVIRARPTAREKNRCPRCGARSPVYDKQDRTRRWRSLDFGSWQTYIESKLPRIKCPTHGVVVARVPWARHDSDYTLDFEMAVTWMTLHATVADVSEMYRVKWGTVASIARRVQLSMEQSKPDRFDNLVAIGIDETSYKKGHKYMTVVVNHETGSLVWAHKGHGKEVLEVFFKELTEEQRSTIKFVTADGARWIADCVKEYCENAKRCIDPFHVVMWATEALDEVRKSVGKEAEMIAADGKKNGERSTLPSIPC